MIVKMVVNPCESGRSVMKSTAMWDQGLTGTSKGTVLLASNVLGLALGTGRAGRNKCVCTLVH